VVRPDEDPGPAPPRTRRAPEGDPPRESDRFLRPQPPRPIPPRPAPAYVPGLVAYAVLGARVVK
jgi:hypothetical protein